MSKGARKQVRKMDAQKKEQQRVEKKKQHRKKLLKVWGIVLGCALGAAAITVGVVLGWNALLDSGIFLRSTVAASSANYSVDNAMMTCFVQDSYQSYLQTNADYLDYIDLDTTQPLADQEQSDGVTWLDYFRNTAKTKVTKILSMTEAATAAGVTLTQEETAAIETQLEGIDPTVYGRGINVEDIRKCLTLSALAAKYDTQMTDSLTCSDEEIETYYEQNTTDFVTVNYDSYTIDYYDDEDTTTLSEAQAQTFAEELASCADESAFRLWVTSFLDLYSDYTDDEKSEELEGLTTTGEDYTEGEAASEWMFEDGRTVNGTFMEQNSDSKTFTVYMLLSLPARDESPTIAVRHILLSSDTYGDDALNKAEDVLAQWQDGEQTEESFAALAKTYSEDSTASTGGLYEGVYQGQMVDTFNDWCFDESRQTGDTDIVQTSYGYHVMYFVRQDLPKWQTDARSKILDDKYEQQLSNYETTYAVTFHDAALAEVSI